MCVIAYKPLGAEPITREVLQKCWDANDHGAGYAWFDAEIGMWQVRKGFMTWKKFWKSYKQQPFNNDSVVIAHFRIGTSGAKDGGSTHPFPVTDVLEDMRKNEFAAESILFHNGVVGRGEGDYSDTMVHIRDFVAPLIHLLGVDDRIPKIYDKILGEGSSRFLLTKGASLWRFGNTWIERNKSFFSNATWEYKCNYVYSSYSNNAVATTVGSGAGFTGDYGAGARNNKWRSHQGYANEFGRYVGAQWIRWDESDNLVDFTQSTENNGVIDFSKSKKRKAKGKEAKDKEDHSRTRTLFTVVGDDGSLKLSDKALAYVRERGVQFIICPNCYEDKYIDYAPAHCVGTGADSLCGACGAIFNDITGEILMHDLETARKGHTRGFSDIVRKPANWSKLTPADKQVIIDQETDELLKTGNC